MTVLSFTSPSQPCRRAITWTILLVFTLCCCHGQEHVRQRAHTEHRVTSLSVLDSRERESWNGVTLSSVAAAVEQDVRREKSTKTLGSESKGNEDSTKSSTRSSTGLVTAKATGLSMTLGGVNPLDEKARKAWKDVTLEFIGEDIMRLSRELNQLEVSVKFVSQSPTYKGASRKLDSIRQMMVEISFDVVIKIESEIENHNANKYVAHAFSSDARKIVYMRKLLATGNPAFFNIGAVSVDANLVPDTNESKKDAKEIGAIVGFAVMGVVCVAAIVCVLYGTNRTNMVDVGENDEDREHGSNKQSRTETDSVSSEGDPPSEAGVYKLPGGVMPDEESLVSHYYEGNISVAWSLDTDIPQTPRIHNSKTLLGGFSRESSEGSLFADDSTTVHSPATDSRQRSSPVVKAVQDDALVANTKEKELYEV